MHYLKALALCLLVPASVSANDKGPEYSQITGTNDLAAEDDLAIRQVIARLNQALDMGDYDLYASFYAPDAVFTSGFGDAEGREAVAAALEMSRPFITNKRHASSNLIINGAGDKAVVTSYLVVFERETELAYVGSAVNVDTMEKRDGTWFVVLHESTLDPATQRAMMAVMESR